MTEMTGLNMWGIAWPPCTHLFTITALESCRSAVVGSRLFSRQLHHITSTTSFMCWSCDLYSFVIRFFSTDLKRWGPLYGKCISVPGARARVCWSSTFCTSPPSCDVPILSSPAMTRQISRGRQHNGDVDHLGELQPGDLSGFRHLLNPWHLTSHNNEHVHNLNQKLPLWDLHHHLCAVDACIRCTTAVSTTRSLN